MADTKKDEPGGVGDQPLGVSGVPGEKPRHAEPDASVEAVKEVGGDQVQAQFDEAADKGYFGESPDETPRERYTLQGQQQNQ